MKNKKSIYIILSFIMFLLVGCSDDDKDDDIISTTKIDNTQWKGTYDNSRNEIRNIVILFDNQYGSYILDNENNKFNFSYQKTEKKIAIGGYKSGVLSGDWWIYKLTEKEFILKTYPLEKEQSIITLQKVF